MISKIKEKKGEFQWYIVGLIIAVGVLVMVGYYGFGFAKKVNNPITQLPSDTQNAITACTGLSTEGLIAGANLVDAFCYQQRDATIDGITQKVTCRYLLLKNYFTMRNSPACSDFDTRIANSCANGGDKDLIIDGEKCSDVASCTKLGGSFTSGTTCGSGTLINSVDSQNGKVCCSNAAGGTTGNGACTGVAQLCSTTSVAECASQNGCTLSSTTPQRCDGRGISCTAAALTNSQACGVRLGCTWQAA